MSLITKFRVICQYCGNEIDYRYYRDIPKEIRKDLIHSNILNNGNDFVKLFLKKDCKKCEVEDEDCINCQEEIRKGKGGKCDNCQNPICRECLGMATCQNCYKTFCNNCLKQCQICLENFCIDCIENHVIECYEITNDLVLLKEKFSKIIEKADSREELNKKLNKLMKLEFK